MVLSSRCTLSRMKELELSEKKLLETVEQLNGDMYFLENVNVRIKARLQDIQDELQEVNQAKEKMERTHKEKVRRLQDHLRTKEGEIKSYLEYFEHYKEKRRQQLRMLREREHHLQNQVLKLEKEIVDRNAVSVFLITEHGETNGHGDVLSAVPENFMAHKEPLDLKDDQTITNDAENHWKSQIQRLQKDLKARLEREDTTNREKEELLNRLQQSEDNEDFLNRKLEEFRCRISELKLSEYNLQQLVEDLEEENGKLQNELKVNSGKESEGKPLSGSEETVTHTIVTTNPVLKARALAQKRTTEEVESVNQSSRDVLLRVFEGQGLGSKDVLQRNKDLFKELQYLFQTMKSLKFQSEVAERHSAILEKERDTIEQDYQQILGDFEGLQLGFDKTCCQYVARVLELQQSAMRNTHLESFFESLNQAIQEEGQAKQLLRLCSAVEEFVKAQDIWGKYKDLLYCLSHLTSQLQIGYVFFEDELLRLKWQTADDGNRNNANQSSPFTQSAKDPSATSNVASACDYGNLHHDDVSRTLHFALSEHNSSPLSEVSGDMTEADSGQAQTQETKSKSGKEISILLRSTFNQLKQGQMLLSSFKHRNTRFPAEEPTKEQQVGFLLQQASINIPLATVSSHHMIREAEMTGSFPVKSDVIPLSAKPLGVNVHASNITGSTKWLENDHQSLILDISGVYSDSLKDSMLKLEFEIVKLQAEKCEQKNQLETKEEFLQKISMHNHQLQESLEEANKLLYMWATKNTLVWREEHGLNEQKQEPGDVYKQIVSMDNRLEPQMEKDHCLQGMFLPPKECSGNSQRNLALNKGNGSSSTISAYYHADPEHLQDVHHKENQPSIRDSEDLEKETEICCINQKTEKREFCIDSYWITKDGNGLCQMESEMQAEHNAKDHHRSTLQSQGGYIFLKKQCSTGKEKSDRLDKEPKTDQHDSEYISKVSLNDECNACLMQTCALEKQLDARFQHLSSLHQEEHSDETEIDSQGETNSRNADPHLGNCCSKKLCALEKGMDSLAQKIDALQQGKESYSQKLLSLEQSNSRAIQKIAELEEEKHKYSQKIYVLEKENESYAQRVHLLEKENSGYSEQIKTLKGHMPKIALLEEENQNYAQKTSALQKDVNNFSQKVIVLQTENVTYLQKLSFLEDEKNRHCQVSCALKEQVNTYLQKISILEQDVAKNGIIICAKEKKNNMFLEKLLNLEQEFDMFSQKIQASYETHSEYTPIVTTMLGKPSTSKNDSFREEGNSTSVGQVCIARSILPDHTSPGQSYDGKKSGENSGTGKETEGLQAETVTQKCFSLEQKKLHLFQLMSDVAEERQRYCQQISELLQDKDECLKKVYHLEEEKVRCLGKIAEHEGEKETLLGNVLKLNTENEKHLKELTTLQEEQAKCCQMLAEKQKENTKLRNKIYKLRKETSEQMLASSKAAASIVSENKDLKELILHLKGTYENLIKDTMVGMEEMVKGLETENETLLNRIHQMETDSASEISKHMEHILKEREHLVNRIEELENEARSKENEGLIPRPTNKDLVTLQDSGDVVILQQSPAVYIMSNTNSDKRDGKSDTQISLSFNKLRGISEEQGDSQLTTDDGKPLHGETQGRISNSHSDVLSNSIQQPILNQEKDESSDALYQENTYLHQKLEEAQEEIMQLKQHHSQRSADQDIFEPIEPLEPLELQPTGTLTVVTPQSLTLSEMPQTVLQTRQPALRQRFLTPSRRVGQPAAVRPATLAELPAA
ncbi:uncharacterized protein C4orf50 homolog [Ambystoma mexicanum]|uniref:uncharacterized protein C4orf50 homolog n=1 Tax=Ambystoma mexicanum TaxID=8296 RepID=UPI0037E96F60